MRRRMLTLWLAGLFAGLLLAGCGGGSGGGSGSSAEEGPTVGFAFSLPYLLNQSGGGGAGGLQAAIQMFSSDQVVRGVLLAVNIDTFDHQTFDWSVYIDDRTLQVQSNKTVILDPGRYDFFLLLIDGDRHYAGTAYLQTIRDGTNTIPLTIRPIVGDVTTDVNVVGYLGDFRFHYDPNELSGFASPQLGVIVDGGGEQVFAVDPATGLSAYMLLNLTPGTHQIRLKFYEGDDQRGKSKPEQETVLVSPGVPVSMDLVPLQGEAQFWLTEAGGDATFRFILPAEVVDEAGGAGDLEVALAAVGADTGLHEAVATVTPFGGDYLAEAVVPGFQFESVSLSIAFSDVGDSPKYLLGGCLFAVTLSSSAKSALCPITLIRRSVMTGNLLATVAVNVFSDLGEPVAGAIVSADGVDVGITGGGFGTAGYVKFLLPAGDYTLSARAGGMTGSTDVTLLPLHLHNVDIVLDTPMP